MPDTGTCVSPPLPHAAGIVDSIWGGDPPQSPRSDRSLGACLRRHYPDISQPAAREAAIANTAMLATAGFETVSVSVAVTLAALALTPATLTALEAELATAGLLPVPGHSPAAPLTEAAVRTLPYLNAVAHESLRLFPPMPLGGARQLSRTLPVCGQTLAAGTVVRCENSCPL